MTSQSLNRACGVDVLAVMDESSYVLSKYGEHAGFRLNEARAAVADLIEACRAYVGPMDDPCIGWCGHLPSNNDVFRCERCDEENLDSSFIEHKPGCSAVRLLAALAAVKAAA